MIHLRSFTPGWGLAAALGGGVAALAYWRRTLTFDGALAAAVEGAIVFRRGGLPAAAALLVFFGGSSGLARVGAKRKRLVTLPQAKGTRRDAWQVLANGGFATLSAAFGRERGGGGCLGGLAAAGADTWATELGTLARAEPRLITHLSTRVATGTSGGITPEGLLASVAGALSVGLAWSALEVRPRGALHQANSGACRGVPTALVAGTLGSLVDSWLGATLQALYRCPLCDELTEQPVHPRCGQPATLVRGQWWVTNDVVNALATLSGALVGAACWQRGRQRP